MRAALTAGSADMAAAQITPDAKWLVAGLATLRTGRKTA